jgi:hypothetical protein
VTTQIFKYTVTYVRPALMFAITVFKLLKPEFRYVKAQHISITVLLKCSICTSFGRLELTAVQLQLVRFIPVSCFWQRNNYFFCFPLLESLLLDANDKHTWC